MEWLEISVQADGEAAEAVSEVFNRLNGEEGGRGGAVITIGGFGEDGVLRSPVVTISTYLACDGREGEHRRRIEEALWHLRQLHSFPEPRARRLAEEDWANAWKAHYHPFRVGEHLVIAPSWESTEPELGDTLISLDPGMAFGTGLHPSTRLCLTLLETHLQPGSTVLDLGTGSGILAIAAAKSGAASVVARDIDPVAVGAARENVARNGVDHIVRVEEGSLPETGGRAEAGFDLVLVNILAEVIVRLLGEGLTEIINPGGRVILSGIITPKAADVEAALAERDFTLLERREEGDWVALLAREKKV
ncbi:MAG: 50S ribosomal protein L11 methyltransferase [Anaerolineae bacterium]|nr:50S ribosomal protein L11 methyltransferase [Anaerolineae bacterium]